MAPRFNLIHIKRKGPLLKAYGRGDSLTVPFSRAKEGEAMAVMNEKTTYKESIFCDKCNKTTQHEVTVAKQCAGRPKTLRRKKVVKTICLECRRKKFQPNS